MRLLSTECTTIASLLGLLLSRCSAVRTFAPKPNVDLIEQTETKEEWVSVDEQTQFLPASAMGKSRFLTQTNTDSSQFNPYSSQSFVDGSYEYDEYQQAWRYLGFVIDCDASTDDDGRSGSYDAGTGEGCHRYVLWAAYVDLEYEGGGIGEYQFWNRTNQQWDDTSCQYGEGGSGDSNDNGSQDNGGQRCAKMDCHLEDTHFSLLGFFKHKSYDDWMEQLFKHEGYCVWTNQEYSFMKNARKTWPQGCIQSGTTDEEGNSIYYDIKPTTSGGITLGLYTDTRCVEEYRRTQQDDPITIENVIGNILMENGSHDSNDNGGDDSVQYDTLEESLAAWDSAFEIFKICQPCVAYDLNNVGYDTDDDASKGSSYWIYNQNDDDQNDGNDAGWADFDCYDDADYTNVNQCMKFMAKTTMNAATYRDLSLGKEQGTLVDIPLSGLNTRSVVQSSSVKSGFLTVLFFMVSVVACMYSALKLYGVRRRTHRRYDPTFEQPLATDVKEGTMA